MLYYYGYYIFFIELTIVDWDGFLVHNIYIKTILVISKVLQNCEYYFNI